MIKPIHIEEDLFNIDAYLFVGNGDREEIKKSVIHYFAITDQETIRNFDDHFFSKNSGGQHFELTSVDGLLADVLWVTSKKEDYSTEGLVHEINHLTSKALLRRGIRHTEDTEEVYAYLNGWFVSEFKQRMDKKKKVRK